MFNKFCQVIDNDMKNLNKSWNKTLILKSICCFWNWKKKILLCCVMTKMRFGQNICHRFRYGYRIWFKPITFSLYAHDSTRLTNFDSNSFYDSWNTNWDFRYPNMYFSLWLTEFFISNTQKYKTQSTPFLFEHDFFIYPIHFIAILKLKSLSRKTMSQGKLKFFSFLCKTFIELRAFKLKYHKIKSNFRWILMHTIKPKKNYSLQKI